MYLPIFSRQLWSSVTTRSKIQFQGGVKDWILTGAWSVSAPVTKKNAALSVHDSDQLSEAIVNDVLRMASAAFESARAVGVCGIEPRSYAWQFISYYYAGYFAANALMRLCGHSCTNLSAQECSEINEIASLCGLGGIDDKTKIAPGVYYSTINRGGTATLSFSAINSKGGVHIQFWTGFLKFLLELKKTIISSALPKSDREGAIAELNELIDGLKHSGSQTGAWLSEVRNAMNYRLEYGAWFPYTDTIIDGNDLRKILKASIDGTIALPKSSQFLIAPERATRITAFLLSWLRISLVTLANSSTGQKRKIISRGPLAMGDEI